MLVLALDSATSACSAAVWRDGDVIAHQFRAMERGQSEWLIPMIDQVMRAAQVTFGQLDLLAVTVGPGAFTGIRIGLSAARALALATGVPLAGLPTTHVVAAAVPEALRRDRRVLVVVESRRQELWVQAFDQDLAPLGDVQALLPDQAAALVDGPLVVAGDAAALVLPHCHDAIQADDATAPDAIHLAALAAQRWPQGRCLPPDPLYLRPADVTMPSCSVVPS